MAAPATLLPTISVVTPSFNQGHYIEQTILSVLNQGYSQLEYLVLDGGSTDQTVEILNRYQGRLHYLSESDRGQAHAINKGLALASGEIVCFLNSDDLLAPGTLQKVGSFFQAHPACAWLTGRCRMIDEHGRETLQAITRYKNFWLRLNNPTVLAVLNFVSQPATFWKRCLLARVGDFDESLQYAMDYDYWLRINQVEKLWVLHETLACFRLHQQSKGATGTTGQFAEDLQVARRHVSSATLQKLHQAHNSMILWAYNRMDARVNRSSQAGQAG